MTLPQTKANIGFDFEICRRLFLQNETLKRPRELALPNLAAI